MRTASCFEAMLISSVLTAALALAVAISTPSLKAIVPGHGDLVLINRILDTAQELLQKGAFLSSSVGETLNMVRNIRHNLGGLLH